MTIQLKQKKTAGDRVETKQTKPNYTGDGLEQGAKLEEALEFFITKVFAGEMGRNELGARVDPRVQIRDGALYVATTDVKDEDGKLIFARSAELEFGKLLSDLACQDILRDAAGKISQIKRSLARNQERLEGLSFLLEALSQNNMGAKELSARLNQNVRIRDGALFLDQSIGRGYVKDEEGREIFARSSELDLGKAVGQLAVSESLEQSAGSFARSRVALNRIKERVAAFEYFIEALKADRMGFNEFSARLNQDLQLEEGDLVVGRRFVQDERENRVFGTESEIEFSRTIFNQGSDFLRFLTTIGRLIINQSEGEAVATAFKTLIDCDSDDESMIKKIFPNEDLKKLQKGIDFVVELNADLRRFRFVASVIEAFVAGESSDDLLKRFNGYDYRTEEDIAFRKRLEELITSKRRIELMFEAVSSFQADQSLDSVVTILRPLFDSRNDQDNQAAQSLLGVVSRFEVTQIGTAACDLLSTDLEAVEVDRFLENIPLRTEIGGNDYRKLYDTIDTFLRAQQQLAAEYRRLVLFNRLRRRCTLQEYTIVAEDIQNFDFGLADDEPARKLIFNEAAAAARSNSPDQFAQFFQDGLQARVSANLSLSFDLPDLGRNLEASKYLTEQFRIIFNPLLQTLRKDPSTREAMQEYLGEFRKDGEVARSRKLPYLLLLEELEKQRPLTDIERAYINSVERLSQTNPALVAMMAVAPDETLEYLRSYFARKSDQTWESLQDGGRVTLAQLGLGPHGVAALAEAVRINPELVREMLVFDLFDMPGGVFAVPEGPAWDLNSASSRGRSFKLPDAPNGGLDETQTVRAYGSPVRWYPGERSKDSESSRGGSINMAGGYLPTPDSISSTRYPTNESEALVIQVQAALLARRPLLNTELLAYETAGDQKILTLEHTDAKGQRETKTILVDGFWGISGLGSDNFGFEVEGTRAEVILAQKTKPGVFPKTTTTLPAFKSLASKRGKKLKQIGETLLIWGSGNSTDTLLEYVGNLFSQSNPIVRNITRIYVVAMGDPSARPRYAAIRDLRGRNGRGNLVVDIMDRVTDVGEAEGDDDKLVAYGADGQVIKDENGSEIQFDHAISAAGFRSRTKQLISADDPDVFVDFALPTDPDLVVGQTLREDPNTLLLGTAAPSRFNNAKKRQLPSTAANALARVGAENAVAIGFRVPETEAAVRVWLCDREFTLEKSPLIEPETVSVLLNDKLPQEIVDRVGIPLEAEIERSNVISNFSLVSSALIGQILREQNVNFVDSTGAPITGKVSFIIDSYLSEDNSFGVQASSESRGKISNEFFIFLRQVFQDPYLFAYIKSSLLSKRRMQALQVDISFSKGKVSPAGTYIE